MSLEPIKFNFLKNKNLMGASGAGSIEISPSTEADVFQSILENKPFPRREIELGKLSIQAHANKAVKFKEGGVDFNLGAETKKELALFQDPENLLKALAPNNNTAPALDFKRTKDIVYMLLRWDYNVSADGKGSIGLGTAGSVKFGGAAGKKAMYALVRSFTKETGARDVIGETIDSWKLPTHVDNIDDLDPGTWLIAEIDGTLAANLGINIGYDFNWVREAKLNQLSGDIGLRLQLGVGATVGFNASGKYALVLCRDSMKPEDKTLRLRIFKLKKKKWDFAFNASANIKGDFDKLLPAKADEFVAAVFGFQGSQVMKDLEIIGKWATEDDIAGKLAELGKGYILDFIKEITGIDPLERYKDAYQKVKKLFDSWNELPHSAATLLWKVVGEETREKIAKFHQQLKDIVSMSDPKNVVDLIRKELEKSDFFRTPFGKWLETIAKGKILALLDDVNNDQVKQAAEKALKLLDVNNVEEMLRKLQTLIKDKLKVEKISNVVDKANPDSFEKYLLQKLADFFGKAVDTLKVDEVQKTIKLLLEKHDEFYKKVKKALNRTYGIDLAVGYSKSTTRTALVDVNFDFSKANSSLGRILANAVDGKFDSLFTEEVEGITLKTAVLSHQINHQSFVELTMPFYDYQHRHINNSLAKKVKTTNNGGGVVMYHLESEDVVIDIDRGKCARDSQLAVAYKFKDELEGVRIFSDGSIDMQYTHTYRMARKNMKIDSLDHQFAPLVEKYLPDTFGETKDGINKGSFVEWLHYLDMKVDESPDIDDKILGNTLISLELSLPQQAMAAWFNAPEKKEPEPHQYQTMTERLQNKLRELLSFYFFQDLGNYGDIKQAATILVYSSLDEDTYQHGDDLHDRGVRKNIVTKVTESSGFAARITRIHDQLVKAGLYKIAEQYDPDDVNTFGNLKNKTMLYDSSYFYLLLRAEKTVIEEAKKTGHKMAEFMKVSQDKTRAAKALKLLAEFGAKITATFNQKIRKIFTETGKSFYPFGTLLMLEAASALDPDMAQLQPTAMLGLTVVKKTSGFKPENFLKDEVPEEETDILCEERLVFSPTR